MPTMHVVAGPSGSGKTSAFPGSQFGCDYLNADDYAAQLNGGSYIGIPKSIRTIVGPMCERFIQDHIVTGRDFATETTLRSTAVFDQIKQAHDAGFDVRFRYVAINSLATSIDRVANRADLGGHSGSEDTVRDIRSKSFGNFPRVFAELGKTIDVFDIFDNSAFGEPPERIAGLWDVRLLFWPPSYRPGWMKRWGRLPTRPRCFGSSMSRGRLCRLLADRNPGQEIWTWASGTTRREAQHIVRAIRESISRPGKWAELLIFEIDGNSGLAVPSPGRYA